MEIYFRKNKQKERIGIVYIDDKALINREQNILKKLTVRLPGIQPYGLNYSIVVFLRRWRMILRVTAAKTITAVTTDITIQLTSPRYANVNSPVSAS